VGERDWDPETEDDWDGVGVSEGDCEMDCDWEPVRGRVVLCDGLELLEWDCDDDAERD